MHACRLRRFLLAVVLMAAGVVAPLPAAAQPADSMAAAEPGPMPALYPDSVVTRSHEITADGEALAYTSRAGYLPLRAESGELEARMFFTAYTRSGTDASDRPITFVFNGGPGSSSVWLHLGGVGPKRVQMTDGAEPVAPPFDLRANPQTWLRFTDLVFIDPVTTGFSRAAPGVENDRFHGVEGDIRSVARFIRLYTTRYERWASPKFLAGESYGTTRAAGLAEHLQDQHGMYLNGVVLVSAVLNFQANDFDVGNDLPYPLFLPTYAATAHYHEQLPAAQQRQSLDALLDEVERFAETTYTTALMRGADLDAQTRSAVVDTLSRYTGLASSFIANANLRVPAQAFFKELLREEGRTVGRLDSRFTGEDRTDIGAYPEYDPSYAAILGPFTAALNHYMRRELGFETDLPYEILTGRVRPWSYDTAKNEYLNVAERLREAMHKNPSLQVHIASGYYDVATPYFASDYVVDHLGLAPDLRSNVSTSYYEAGHMMYIRDASLQKLYDQVSGFYQAATGE
jgi:carboxypeptidase C (cathepsin A)